jgi:putative spermidine/putrescine transport system permease protein
MIRAASQRYALLLCLPLATLVVGLLAWPVALLARESVGLAPSSAGFTLSSYAAIALDARPRQALLWSLGLSAAIAALSTLLCIAPAWLLVRYTFPGRRVLRAIYALPLSLSGVIVGFLMVIMLGRAGFVPRMTEWLTGEARLASAAYHFAGVVIAYLYFEIPRATLTLEAAFRRVDFAAAGVARSLGASRMQAFAHVVLPAIRPALVSTMAVTFSVSLGSFGVILILSTRDLSVLPLEIFMAYLAFPSDRQGAAAMSLVLLVAALSTNYAARVWLERAPDRPTREPASPTPLPALPPGPGHDTSHARA